MKLRSPDQGGMLFACRPSNPIRAARQPPLASSGANRLRTFLSPHGLIAYFFDPIRIDSLFSLSLTR